MADKLKVGSAPPAFSLPDQDGKTVKPSEYKGHWLVLYFYPNDDTPGCTTEACDFTNGLKDFEKLDAAVVGCSPEQPESHSKFIAKYKLKVRLLSDPEHEAMDAYGAWGEKVLYGKKSIGVIRSTVIVGPDGKVAHHWARVKRRATPMRSARSSKSSAPGRAVLSGAAFRSRARVLPLRAPPHWTSLPRARPSEREPARPTLHGQVALARRHRGPAGPRPPRHPRRSLHAAGNEDGPSAGRRSEGEQPLLGGTEAQGKQPLLGGTGSGRGSSSFLVDGSGWGHGVLGVLSGAFMEEVE